MKNNYQLYYNKTHFKLYFLVKLFIGSSILYYMIILLQQEVVLGVWSFALPLLGLALIITSLSEARVKQIEVNSITKELVVTKETIFRTMVQHIDLFRFSVTLHSDKSKKIDLFQRVKLSIIENTKEVLELKSTFLGTNSLSIRLLYRDLKEIQSKLNSTVQE